MSHHRGIQIITMTSQLIGEGFTPFSRGSFHILSRHTYFSKPPKTLQKQLVFEKNDGCKEWTRNQPQTFADFPGGFGPRFSPSMEEAPKKFTCGRPLG